jgi:hypothetical protein
MVSASGTRPTLTTNRVPTLRCLDQVRDQPLRARSVGQLIRRPGLGARPRSWTAAAPFSAAPRSPALSWASGLPEQGQAGRRQERDRLLEAGPRRIAVIGAKPARHKALAPIIVVQAGVGSPRADPDPLRTVATPGGLARPVEQRGTEPDSGVGTPDDQAVDVDRRLVAEIIGPVRIRSRSVVIVASGGQAGRPVVATRHSAAT